MNPMTASRLIFLALILMPLYVFPSGGLQPVDIPIIVLMAYVLFTLCQKEKKIIGVLFISFLVFIFWALLVNSYYYTVFYKPCFFKPIIHLLYSLSLFFTFIVLFYRLIRHERTIPYIYFGLLISFSLIPFVKGQTGVAFTARQTLSFNDPNQLADYAILGIAIILVLHHFYKDRIISARMKTFTMLAGIVIIALAHVYVFLSASRAGMGCMILLDLYAFWTINRKLFLLAAVFMPLLLFLVKDTVFLKNDISETEVPVAVARLDSNIMEVVIARVAGRVDFKDISLLFGIGKCSGSPGLRDGYNNFNIEREAHNTVVDILYCYGLIGLMLFSIFIAIYFKQVFVVRYHIPIIVSFLPINISQNFIRFRMLWVFYALLFSISIIWQEKNDRR